MIARLASLRKHPPVFRHLTGLTVRAFDALAADVVPAVEAAHQKTLDRTDRRRAIVAGGEYNRAFRRRRIVVEHAIGRLSRFRTLAHVNRHRRAGHTRP